MVGIIGGLMAGLRIERSGFELCPWARHLTLTGTLFTQVYNWVPAN